MLLFDAERRRQLAFDARAQDARFFGNGAVSFLDAAGRRFCWRVPEGEGQEVAALLHVLVPGARPWTDPCRGIAAARRSP